MRVLAAGDRGYIGAVIVPFIKRAGHEVVGLDAGWYDGCDFESRRRTTSSAPATSAMFTPTTSPAWMQSSTLRPSPTTGR